MGSIIICKYILNYAFIVYLRIININLVNYLYFNCICDTLLNMILLGEFLSEVITEYLW